MQQTQLAVLNMGDSLPIYNSHREERERGLDIIERDREIMREREIWEIEIYNR